jgi:DNA polymerase III alpha subunit (gram-positive type)
VKHPILRIDAVSDEIYEVSDLRIDGFSERRFWVFDLEATGLDTSKERVTQIAGVPVTGTEILEDQAFSTFVNPTIDIPEEIVELTGITQDMVKDAPPFLETWPNCVAAGTDCDIWIGQSVFEFDVPLLEAELDRHGMPAELPPILDSVVIATKLLGPPAGRWSTSALLQRFGVDITGMRRHNALTDVKILGRILVGMIDLIRREHDDQLVIRPGERLPIKRHPPVES